MLAISIKKGTIYAYNLKSETDLPAIVFNSDQICLQSSKFLSLQAYIVTIERDCKHVLSVSDLRMQANLVPF